MVQLEIVDPKSNKTVLVLDDIQENYTINEVKYEIYRKNAKLVPDRQGLRLEPRGKFLTGDESIKSLKLPPRGGQIYLRDLGPQISWRTVFMLEYFGPFAIYPLFYLRPSIIYGSFGKKPIPDVMTMALACWSFHYGKRLFETMFIHRFSHGTMPIRNLFKNSGYYWGFAVFIAYFVNHPLYTLPKLGKLQIYAGLAGFIFSELGNLSIHLALRNLRPEGSRERRIPMPTSNPFTNLFSFVSCPNYTYEVCAWLSFSIMTQSLPALMFTVVGFAQMAVWAKGKHRNYKKEFPDYPRGRKAILPFLI